MATPRIPNQKKKYSKLNNRLNAYVLLVKQIYDDIALEASKIYTNLDIENTDIPFSFADFPRSTQSVKNIFSKYITQMSTLIYSGTTEEWKRSNEALDLMVKDALRQYNVKSKGEVLTKYFQPNNDALKAFQNRVENGMHLSDKLWQHTNGIQKELEAAISTAVEKGTSAVKLSKQVSKYLNDAEQLRKDYKDKFNKATDIHDCEYRSARLARSEINIAYRTAEQTRWQQLDFVVGYEIKPSANHKIEDICDILAGRYPKDFKWVGWHPNCTDFAIPILKTEDEFFDDDRTTKSKNEVTDVPESFKQWCHENEQNITIADKQGTLPYFIKDNKAKVNDIIKDNKTSVVAKKRN